MSRTVAISPLSSTTAMSFTLLTLFNVIVRTSTTSEAGTLFVDYTSDGSRPSYALDSGLESTLTLRLNGLTFPLGRWNTVQLIIAPSGQRSYSFVPGGDNDVYGSSEKRASRVKIIIPPPKVGASVVAQEDVETFDNLLTQYGDLSWSYGDPDLTFDLPPPLPARPTTPRTPNANIGLNVEEAKPIDDPSLRGRLVLMDEANGEVLGQLPHTMNITEDPALTSRGTNPVMLEMHPDMYDACTGIKEFGSLGNELLETREVFARAVPAEEQDWIMKSATLVRYAALHVARCIHELMPISVAKPSLAPPLCWYQASPQFLTSTSATRRLGAQGIPHLRCLGQARLQLLDRPFPQSRHLWRIQHSPRPTRSVATPEPLVPRLWMLSKVSYGAPSVPSRTPIRGIHQRR